MLSRTPVTIPAGIGTPKFRAAHAMTLAWEGDTCSTAAGETWETCYGISRKANPDMPWPPTRDQAIQRAFSHYWIISGSEDLPTGVGIQHYDHSFNAGILTGSQVLESAGDPPDADEYAAARLRWYTTTRRELRDLNLAGWVRRVADMITWADFQDPDAPRTPDLHGVLMAFDMLVMDHITLGDRFRILFGSPPRLPGGWWARVMDLTRASGTKMSVTRRPPDMGEEGHA